MATRLGQVVDQAIWAASAEIAAAVADASHAGELGQQIMTALERMVGCDLGSIMSAVPGEDWAIIGEIADNRPLQKNYWRYVGEMSSDEVRQLAGSFSLATEVFQPQRRQRLSVFREFLDPRGLKEILTRNWFSDGRVWAVGLTRTRPSFSDRDIARLNAILPHVRAALRARSWFPHTDCDSYLRAGEGGSWDLTPAQERTISLVVRGLTNKEIAGLLGISPNTVRNTLVEVFKKVGVTRRSELAFIVHSCGVDGDQRRTDDELARHQQLAAMIAANGR
jgi:DNA-binding CsgD family transcriptional regulator